VSDFNAQIIDEFRANGGTVGGPFEKAAMILVHHRGAKSGFAVFASRGGAPEHPSWFHNLVANPDTVVEVGTETIPVRARVLEGDEREAIWTKQKEAVPVFADYERRADGIRQIPVILFERR
jgi:deazaflavin-dependent oxidoreductase (nitroreductase family)